ncbi:unnamed protein product [Cuscuta campestris]|uniref:Uncharacterized protein n=1 Tax=Cuscuta campestris TaxID=132261 RepID=A0A484MXW2_9ASTE|nr:unnamed protein product [Cuscuta campestris]
MKKEIGNLYALLEFKPNEPNKIHHNEWLANEFEDEEIEMDKIVESNIAQEGTPSLGQPPQYEEFDENEYYLEQENLWADFENEYQETLKNLLDKGILVRVNNENHNNGLEGVMPEENLNVSPLGIEEKRDDQGLVCSSLNEGNGEHKSELKVEFLQKSEGIDHLGGSVEFDQNVYLEESPLEKIIQRDLDSLKIFPQKKGLFEPLFVKSSIPKALPLLEYLLCLGVISSFYRIFTIPWLH